MTGAEIEGASIATKGCDLKKERIPATVGSAFFVQNKPNFGHPAAIKQFAREDNLFCNFTFAIIKLEMYSESTSLRQVY
jgi:hypothetical protein